MIANSVSSQPQCSGQPLSFDGNQTTFTVVEILNGESTNIEGSCQGQTQIEKQDETAISHCATCGKGCDVSSVQEATDKPSHLECKQEQATDATQGKMNQPSFMEDCSPQKRRERRQRRKKKKSLVEIFFV